MTASTARLEEGKCSIAITLFSYLQPHCRKCYGDSCLNIGTKQCPGITVKVLRFCSRTIVYSRCQKKKSPQAHEAGLAAAIAAWRQHHTKYSVLTTMAQMHFTKKQFKGQTRSVYYRVLVFPRLSCAHPAAVTAAFTRSKRDDSAGEVYECIVGPWWSTLLTYVIDHEWYTSGAYQGRHSDDDCGTSGDEPGQRVLASPFEPARGGCMSAQGGTAVSASVTADINNHQTPAVSQACDAHLTQQCRWKLNLELLRSVGTGGGGGGCIEVDVWVATAWVWIIRSAQPWINLEVLDNAPFSTHQTFDWVDRECDIYVSVVHVPGRGKNEKTEPAVYVKNETLYEAHTIYTITHFIENGKCN